MLCQLPTKLLRKVIIFGWTTIHVLPYVFNTRSDCDYILRARPNFFFAKNKGKQNCAPKRVFSSVYVKYHTLISFFISVGVYFFYLTKYLPLMYIRLEECASS